MKYIFTALLSIVALNTHAWDGNRNGKISVIDVTGAQIYGFRLLLKGNPILCSLSSSQQATWPTSTNQMTTTKRMKNAYSCHVCREIS